jgi:bacteriorhodopsin
MQVSLVKSSFYFTYIFLITTGTICFIEALRNPVPQIRHIMNLETCISVVAGYFYGLFVAKINKAEKDAQENNEQNKNQNEENELPLEKINDMRYTDWAISTPLMLLVLCMVLGMENKKVVNFLPFILILIFNFLMLGAGYIGEIGKLTRTMANSIGFLFFFLMYGTVWKVYMTGPKRTKQSVVIFGLFAFLWALYGVLYQTDKMTKVFGYNILDLLSKAFVGIFFWFYLTKSIRF